MTERRTGIGRDSLRQPQGGFTYLGLLFAVALAGIALAATGVVWTTEARREKERELLFIGDEFRNAIADYYERTPGMVKRFPGKLDDLLKDERYLRTERRLRQVYRDPMTGERQWGLVSAPDGGVMGVYSLSAVRPIKQGGFTRWYTEFAGSQQYSDWKFVYRPVAQH
jgi:type II secretory pathway pseudopilin PulG